jgi:hypothetical protein
MFSKRLECGKLLVQIENVDLANNKQSTTPPPESLVFYSPTLNTCVLRTKLTLIAPTAKTEGVNSMDVEDLLTGEGLERHLFHMSVPGEATEEETFDRDLMERYGAQPDKTPPPRNKP